MKSFQKKSLNVGDILACLMDSLWYPSKILELEKMPDGAMVAHVLTYKPVSMKPSLEDIAKLEVMCWHFPIATGGLSEECERIGNCQPKKEEFVGYETYLKETNFPKYVEFTGQDLETIMREAHEHYQLAIKYSGEGKLMDAVKEYSHAIEIFPFFHEAIDNRGFTKMKLGDYEKALEDFNLSQSVYPEGNKALFTIGECLFKLGKIGESEDALETFIARFPDQKEAYNYLKRKIQAARGESYQSKQGKFEEFCNMFRFWRFKRR